MKLNGISNEGFIAPAEDEVEHKHMSVKAAILLMSVSTAAVAVMSEILVESVEHVCTQAGLGHVFTGVIVLAIMGNVAEHSSAVTAAWKNKLEISIGIAYGSSIQIGLFVFPVIVLLSLFRAGGMMTMVFTNMECIAIFFGCLCPYVITQDSETTWLEGMLLLCLYVCFAIIFFYVEEDEPV